MGHAVIAQFANAADVRPPLRAPEVGRKRVQRVGVDDPRQAVLQTPSQRAHRMFIVFCAWLLDKALSGVTLAYRMAHGRFTHAPHVRLEPGEGILRCPSA